jgi:transcriptional adapter 3
MAPTSSKKGSQAKGNVKNERRSLSRHSTPISAPPDTSSPISRMGTPTTSNPTANMPSHTPYLNTPTGALVSSESSIEDLIDKACAKVSKAGDPPGSRELQVLQNKIQRGVSEIMSKRGEISDRAMRQQVQRRKERAQIEQEHAATRAEEERIRTKREEDERRKEKKAASKKRSHEDMDVDGEEKERKELKESLPSVGAHGLARQDGVGLSEGKFLLGRSSCFARTYLGHLLLPRFSPLGTRSLSMRRV